MRKLFVFNLVTLDGSFEGPNRDIGGHNVDMKISEAESRTPAAVLCLSRMPVYLEVILQYLLFPFPLSLPSVCRRDMP